MGILLGKCCRSYLFVHLGTLRRAAGRRVPYCTLTHPRGQRCQNSRDESFEKLSIKETLPIIKSCDCYIGSDTGFAHIAVGLGVKSLTLFMDSPVMAYGKYSSRMIVVEPKGEKDSTKHDTLGKDKISFEEVLKKSNEILN